MPADFSTANIGVSTKRDVSASLFSDGIFSVGFLEHVLRFSRIRGFGTRRGLKYSRNFFRSVVRSIEEFEMVRGEETILQSCRSPLGEFPIVLRSKFRV